MRKLTASQKIAQLERRVAKMEKEAWLLNNLKELFYEIPRRFFKNIYAQVMLILVRLFKSNSKVIEKYVWAQFEASILKDDDRRIKIKDGGGWVRPRLHKYYHKGHPYKTEIEYPGLITTNINQILEILDGRENDFSALFVSREEAEKYALLFYNQFSRHKTSWMGLFGPLLSAAHGDITYLKSLSDPVKKHYEGEAIRLVTQAGLYLPFSILYNLYSAIAGASISLIKILLYLLLSVPVLAPLHIFKLLFKKLFNKKPNEVLNNPPQEILGIPLNAKTL